MKLKTSDILGIKEMSKEEIELILNTADSFKEILSRPIKKVPTFRGKQVVCLFYEPSTRTRTSFEMAAKILSADTTTITASTSSIVKGESLKDTVKTLEALGCDILIIRHSVSGASHFAAKVAKCPVINAGDGMNEHPTQALLDMFTIIEKKGLNRADRLSCLKGLKVAIIGDIAHSRVARSNIWGLSKMGAEVRICGPQTLIPKEAEKLPVKIFYKIEEAIREVDVIMMLRVQLERQKGGLFPTVFEYSKLFGLNQHRLKLAKEDVLVMHPGPLNRGIEIDTEVAENLHSVIEGQVTNGVAVRMALLYLLLGERETTTKGN